MIIGIATGKRIASLGRTVDEQVTLGNTIGGTLRVTAHDIAAVLPIVYNIIYILILSLNLVVTRTIVSIEITIQGDIVGLHQSTCRVGQQSLTHDRVLDGDITQIALSIGTYGESLVPTP